MLRAEIVFFYSLVKHQRTMDPLPVPIEVFASGEVMIWLDPSGVICLKTVNPHNDPVELAEHEALEIAEALTRLVRAQR